MSIFVPIKYFCEGFTLIQKKYAVAILCRIKSAQTDLYDIPKHRKTWNNPDHTSTCPINQICIIRSFYPIFSEVGNVSYY